MQASATLPPTRAAGSLGSRLHVAPGFGLSLDGVYHERAALHRAYALSLTGTVQS